MTRLGNVREINEIKQHLDHLKSEGLITQWELPYEQILTRLTAAVFFVSLPGKEDETVWKEMEKYPMFTYGRNEEKQLSALDWCMTFNKGFEL
ncbi:hypothetical protein HGH93_06260 [Chitinophaga polysaccharea]|uniref:hypothetical protein n=1 Tax=Chitinophaga TaxID=79328 RepID=UPI0014557F6B|nr:MULTISPECIES: hypothetical protein [Chitinophaga]NLR57693.1 hypothetical protein [Chitinophaga polysaccharea]NLU93285.1 hypothetical protein [Chitinophaga sp. Ak27]